MRPGPGRPKGSKNKAPIGLGQYIQESTKGGQELVDYALSVLREKDGDTKARVSERMLALQWLADRGFGRSKETLQLEGSESLAEILMLANVARGRS